MRIKGLVFLFSNPGQMTDAPMHFIQRVGLLMITDDVVARSSCVDQRSRCQFHKSLGLRYPSVSRMCSLMAYSESALQREHHCPRRGK